MPRIVLKHNGALRHLATVEVSHDGSIQLFLVRNGFNESGWIGTVSSEENGSIQKIDFKSPKEKTKKITIHTSGRVNHHGHDDSSQTVFIPCLLDLVGKVPIVVYVVPGIDLLDVVTGSRSNDQRLEFSNITTGHMTFEFSVIPANFRAIKDEFSRLTVEGHYSITCVMFMGDAGVVGKGFSKEGFVTLHPKKVLSTQSIEEDVVFLRFKRLMHANSVKKSLLQIPPELQPTIEIVNEVIAQGPWLTPPNGEGVWTVFCVVQMHHKPELTVVFADSRYSAELVDMGQPNKRLEKVRVRFRVYDKQDQKWIKHFVEIIQVMLEAEL